MRGIVRALAAFMLFVLAPGVVYAQATLAGIARDTSGAVLPGVTVEAASPVLIEKVRTAVTDETGRYAIPDLRPGTYTVTFTLTGFRTVVREGVELSGTAVVTVNADLSVGGVQETITVVRRDARRRPAVNDPTGRDGPGDRVGDSQLSNTLHRRRADPGRSQGRVHRTGRRRLGRPGSGLARSQRRSHLRPAHDGQRRRAQFGDCRRMGRRRRAERDRHSGVRHRRLGRGCTGRDRRRADQLHPARRRQPLQRHDRSPATRPGTGPATTSPAATSRRADSRSRAPSRRTATSIRALADRSSATSSGSSCPGDRSSPTTTSRARSSTRTRTSWIASTTCHRPNQAILHQEQTIYQARLTWQATPKHKFGVTFDQENFCACTTGIGPGPGGAVTSPEAGNDRRFPLQRFVTVDWNTPVSNRLLIEASGIHRVERWGGMEPQVGKLGNIDHLEPGMISVTDTLNPVTGTPLTYRAAHDLQQLLELEYPLPGSGVLHHRIPRLQGGLQQRLPASREHDLQLRRRCRTATTSPRWCRTSITYRIVPRTVEVNVDRDMGLFVQDKWTTGRWTLAGALRLDSFKNSFPAQAIVGHVLRTKPERPVPRDRQPELERRHAEARRDLRRLRQRQDGVEGDAQQVPRGPGHDGIRPRAGIGCAQPDPASC